MPRFHISCILVVTIMLMLMHEGCGTIKCGSTTCWNYDGTCDGGRILDTITRYKIMSSRNVTNTSHKRTSFGNAI